jgi:hypothetical protein
MYVYNISGGVANIFYQICAQIDNNQQVYEAQIQPASSKHHCLHTLCPCKQALTHAQGYR